MRAGDDGSACSILELGLVWVEGAGSRVRVKPVVGRWNIAPDISSCSTVCYGKSHELTWIEGLFEIIHPMITLQRTQQDNNQSVLARFRYERIEGYQRSYWWDQTKSLGNPFGLATIVRYRGRWNGFQVDIEVVER